MALREVRSCEWRERDDVGIPSGTAGVATLTPQEGPTRHLFWKVQGSRVLLQDQCFDADNLQDQDVYEDENFCYFNADADVVPDIAIQHTEDTLIVSFVTSVGTLFRLQFDTTNMHSRPYLSDCAHVMSNTGLSDISQVDVDQGMMVVGTSEGALHLLDAAGSQQAISLFQPAMVQRFLSFFRTSQAGEPQGDHAQAFTSCFHQGVHVTVSVHHNHVLRIATVQEAKPSRQPQVEERSTVAVADLVQIDNEDAISPGNYLVDSVLLEGNRLQVALYVSAGQASQVVVLIVDLGDDMRVSVDRRILGAPEVVESLAIGLAEVVIMATTRDDEDDVLTTQCAVASLSAPSLRSWTPVFKDAVLSTSLVVPPFMSAREVFADHILNNPTFSQATLATALCSRSDLSPDIVAEMSPQEVKDALVLAVEDNLRVVLSAEENTAVDARLYQEKEAECWESLLKACVELEEGRHRGVGVRFDVANDCFYFFTQSDARLLMPCHPLEDLYFRSDILVEEMPFDLDATLSQYPSSSRDDILLLTRAAHDISDLLPAHVTTAFIKRPMRASEALARGLLDGTGLAAATADTEEMEAGHATIDIKLQLASKLRNIRDISGAVAHIIHALKMSAQPAVDAARTTLASSQAIKVISRRCAQLVETLALFARDILVTAHIASATRDLALSGHKRYRDLPRLLRQLCQLCSAYTRVYWCCTTMVDKSQEATLLQLIMEMMLVADSRNEPYAPMETESHRREDRMTAFMHGAPHWCPRAQSEWLRLGVMMQAATHVVICAVANDLETNTSTFSAQRHFTLDMGDGTAGDAPVCALLVSRALLAREEVTLLRDYMAVVGAGAVDVANDAYTLTPVLSALLTYVAGLAYIETRAISKGVALLKSCFAQLSGIDDALRSNALRLLPPLQFKPPPNCSQHDKAQHFLLRFVEHCYRVLEQTLPVDLFSLDDELKAQHMARFQAAFELVEFLELGISLIGSINDPELRRVESTIWWTRLFKYTLHLNLVDEAFMAIMNHKDEATAKACLHQLVVCMYARNQLQRLVQLPYNSYLNDVKEILLRLAKTCDIAGVVLEDQTTYYEILYSIFVFQHDYKTAAAMMAEFAEHLHKLEKPDEWDAASVLFSAQRDAYLSALNALSLVAPSDRWVAIEAVAATEGTSSHAADAGKRKRHAGDVDGDSFSSAEGDDAGQGGDEVQRSTATCTCILSVDDLKRRYALTQAHLDLLSASPEGTYDVTRLPTAHTAVRLLSGQLRFDDAVALAATFGLHTSADAMAPIFERLTEQVMLLRLTPDSPSGWLGFVQRVPLSSSLAPGANHAVSEGRDGPFAAPHERAETLLRELLRAYDSAATGYRFHEIAIDKALSSQLNLHPNQEPTLPDFLTEGLMRSSQRHPTGDALGVGGDPALLMRIYARHRLYSRALEIACRLYVDALDRLPHQGAKTAMVCLPHNTIDQIKAAADKADTSKDPDLPMVLGEFQTLQQKYLDRTGVKAVIAGVQ